MAKARHETTPGDPLPHAQSSYSQGPSKADGSMSDLPIRPRRPPKANQLNISDSSLNSVQSSQSLSLARSKARARKNRKASLARQKLNPNAHLAQSDQSLYQPPTPLEPSSIDWSVMVPEYLDLLEGLPNVLRYIYKHLLELQQNVDQKIDSIYQSTTELINDAHANSLPNEYAPKIQRLRHQVCKTIQLGENKVFLATKAYDVVDSYIQNLDKEMKEHGASVENLIPIFSPQVLSNVSSEVPSAMESPILRGKAISNANQGKTASDGLSNPLISHGNSNGVKSTKVSNAALMHSLHEISNESKRKQKGMSNGAQSKLVERYVIGIHKFSIQSWLSDYILGKHHTDSKFFCFFAINLKYYNTKRLNLQ
jgi:hypothetical protein